MNIDKTLFAQIMEYVPWKTFGRIIDRHGGDSGVRTLDCADLFRIMAFAQLMQESVILIKHASNHEIEIQVRRVMGSR